MILAGELDRRVVIEQRLEEKKASGEVVLTGRWQPLCERWAKVESTSVSKAMVGQQPQPDATHLITMRLPFAIPGPNPVLDGSIHRLRHLRPVEHGGDQIFSIVHWVDFANGHEEARVFVKEAPAQNQAVES